jgi:hypothetical protein
MARVFRPAVRRAGLAPLRFHDLRHTYAALMVAAGAHPKLLQAQLGHTSINVTLNTYGHLFPDAFADVGQSLDHLVEGARRQAHETDLGLKVKVALEDRPAEVALELRSEHVGQRDCPARAVRLRRGHLPARVAAPHPDHRVRPVDVAPTQRQQLSAPHPVIAAAR